MEQFDFYNPTRIIFGKETIGRLDELIPKNAHVMILFGGGSVVKTGTLAEVTSALRQREISQFGGIEPNPTYETLMKAVAQIREVKADFLLAVGGGSVLDGTKFIAAAVEYDAEPWEIMQTHGRVIKSAMPFGAVLTLPATGSEMNNGGVVTRAAIKAKLSFSHECVFPAFSILDPTKTYTLPVRQIANGVVDAFIHITEQYLTYPASGMVQDRFAEGLLQTLIEVGPKAIETPDDYNVRANLMWAATHALNGLISAGVPEDWATHMIGHEITALYGIDHARTLAMVLPSLLSIEKEHKKEKLLQYAERVWAITEGDDEQKIDQAIAKTRVFFESLGIHTSLADYQLGADDVEKIVAQLKEHGMTQLGERKAITLDVSRSILLHSLNSK